METLPDIERELGGSSSVLRSSIRQRFPLVVARLAVVASACCRCWRFDATGRQLLFQWRGPIDPPDDVVLLGIDEASLDPQPSDFGLGRPRALQADLARAVLRQVLAVLCSTSFMSGRSYGPGDDRAFQDALQPWQDRVVLSASLVRQQLENHEQVQLRRSSYSGYSVGLSAFSMNAFGVDAGVPGRERLKGMLSAFPEPHPPALAPSLPGWAPRTG